MTSAESLTSLCKLTAKQDNALEVQQLLADKRNFSLST
jgi:hypothetical protein